MLFRTSLVLLVISYFSMYNCHHRRRVYLVRVVVSYPSQFCDGRLDYAGLISFRWIGAIKYVRQFSDGHI